MATRKEQIREHTIDLLLDKGTLDRVNMNDLESFVTLLHQSEYLRAMGNERAGSWKTQAHLLALEHLNLTEDEINEL